MQLGLVRARLGSADARTPASLDVLYMSVLACFFHLQPVQAPLFLIAFAGMRSDADSPHDQVPEASPPTRAPISSGGARPGGDATRDTPAHPTRREVQPAAEDVQASSEAVSVDFCASEAVSLEQQAKEAWAVAATAMSTLGRLTDATDATSILNMASAFRTRAQDLERRAAIVRETGPVRKVLLQMQRLRQPGVTARRKPPDFDKVFVPYPPRPALPSGKVMHSFWDDTVRNVIKKIPRSHLRRRGHKKDRISAGRMPLLYLSSSFGRGKTRFLREAARHLHKTVKRSGVERDATPRLLGRGIVVLAANFNGDFGVQALEEAVLAARSDEANNFYLLLYVRILFNELADLGTDSAQVFDDFIVVFYGQYRDKQFNFADVYAEARDLVATRAGRGASSDVVVLLVDEIGKLRVNHARLTCTRLFMDICHPIRSESCSLVQAGSGLGVAVMTSMDSALMLAERSASGRPAIPLDYIPDGDLGLQRARLFDAMSLGSLSGVSVAESSGSSYRILGIVKKPKRYASCLEALCAAEVYALFCGLLWRPVELLAIELQQGPAILPAAMLSVEDEMVTESAGNALGLSGLWADHNVHLRDHVLAATILPDEVAQDAAVLPVAGYVGAAATHSSAEADKGVTEDEYNNLSYEKILELRQEQACRAWARTESRTLSNLTWGGILALGVITGRCDSTFSPEMIPLTLLRALNEQKQCKSTPLWEALRAIVIVSISTASGTRDTRGRGLRAQTKFDWCGWELFLLYWERLVSVARALRPDSWGSVTLKQMYGPKGHTPSFVGPGTLLANVSVVATVERTEVVFLEGAGDRADVGCATLSLPDLLSGRVPVDELLRTVYKLPNGAASFDGLCFYRALNSVPGVVQQGEAVAVFYSCKHSTPMAATKSGKDVQQSLDLMCSADGAATKQAEAMFGGREAFTKWRPRSVFVYACMREVSSPLNLTGHLAATTLVLDEADLEVVLGTTMYFMARGLYLLLPPGPRSVMDHAAADQPQSVMQPTALPGADAPRRSPATSSSSASSSIACFYVSTSTVFHLKAGCTHLSRTQRDILVAPLGAQALRGRRCCKTCDESSSIQSAAA